MTMLVSEDAMELRPNRADARSVRGDDIRQRPGLPPGDLFGDQIKDVADDGEGRAAAGAAQAFGRVREVALALRAAEHRAEAEGGLRVGAAARASSEALLDALVARGGRRRDAPQLRGELFAAHGLALFEPGGGALPDAARQAADGVLDFSDPVV